MVPLFCHLKVHAAIWTVLHLVVVEQTGSCLMSVGHHSLQSLGTPPT